MTTKKLQQLEEKIREDYRIMKYCTSCKRACREQDGLSECCRSPYRNIKTSKAREKHTTHGMNGTRPYFIWRNIKTRCYNKNAINYPRYGGQGVKMCDKWRRSFAEFWEDMGDKYFDGAQIDRIDNDGHYEPSNCRWVTLKEQASNKSSVIMYAHDGKTMHAADWEKHLGLCHGAVRARIKKYNWPIEKALSLTNQNK